ncbi:hypothetical protein E1288_45835, partial [Saccharopolyspora elongata]
MTDMRAGHIADSGGLFHPMQCDVQQQRADQSGSDGALLRRRPLRTVLARFRAYGSSKPKGVQVCSAGLPVPS